MCYFKLKRVQDVVLSFIAIVVLFPLMLLIALVIYIDDPKGSPIFSQIRCGKYGNRFVFYKFRTMYVNADKDLEKVLNKNEMDGPVFKIEHDPRITRVGGFLRNTGLDELPQLWNILKGDMSIVGPRPPLPREVVQYDGKDMIRLSVKPGLTCYWQIQPKRNKLTFKEWVDLDRKYIMEMSTWVDWKIIIRTVRTVVFREGM